MVRPGWAPAASRRCCLRLRGQGFRAGVCRVRAGGGFQAPVPAGRAFRGGCASASPPKAPKLALRSSFRSHRRRWAWRPNEGDRCLSPAGSIDSALPPAVCGARALHSLLTCCLAGSSRLTLSALSCGQNLHGASCTGIRVTRAGLSSVGSVPPRSSPLPAGASDLEKQSARGSSFAVSGLSARGPASPSASPVLVQQPILKPRREIP